MHAGIQALMQNLWLEVMVRYEEEDKKKKKKKGEHFECHVHSVVAVCGLQG